MRSRRRVHIAKVNRQHMIVQITRTLGAKRVLTLTAVPLTPVPVLVRKFDLLPRDTPNDEFLGRSWEKEGLCGGVDDVDVLDDVRRGEKWTRFSKGSEGYAVQLEKFHLR